MRDSENIKSLLRLRPDYVGFIFYEKSKRFVGTPINREVLNAFPKMTQKVGVFVNAELAYMEQQIERYGLDMVQLHGAESPETCRVLKSRVKVIKVFSVGTAFDFKKTAAYKPHCDYFLFDTKCKNYGGSGVTFNWDILNAYDNEIPFFLSGGVSLDNFEKVEELTHLNIHAVDVNSRFEIQPALKDISKVKRLIEKIRKGILKI